MYEVWKTDGVYIEGEKVGESEKISEAKKIAKKIDGFNSLVKEIKNPAYLTSNVTYWIEDEELMPIGLIKEVKQ